MRTSLLPQSTSLNILNSLPGAIANLAVHFQEHAEDPFAAFDKQQRPNAYALQKLALEASETSVNLPGNPKP